MSGKSLVRRARFGAIGFTTAAIVLAVVTALLLAHLMKGRGYDQDALVNIVVAKESLRPGVPVRASQLKLVLWPQKSVPPGAFSDPKALLASERKVPLHTIMVGEPVLESRLSNREKGSGMAPLVPNHYRAFPVRLSKAVASSKMVYPGAVVDVMSTVRLEEGGFTSRTILQQVKVLAVNGAVDGTSFVRGGRGSTSKKKPRRSMAVATLLVTAAQSEELALATRVGKINVVLRGASDKSTIEGDGANLSALYPQLNVVAEDADEYTVLSQTKQSKSASRPAQKARRKGPRFGGARKVKPRRRTQRQPRRSNTVGASNIVGG
ncbi:MAG: Flp pilus assembly protein CpaB [Myxococcota bacterium]|nr:Flp pilus assembly protein CpaB [Myxococcota bacterium]